MPKTLPTENNTFNSDIRANLPQEFEEEKNLILNKYHANDNNRTEYDIKEEEIPEIEKLTNSRIITNIGYGGFSIVKLIYNLQQKQYYAMKVVSIIRMIYMKIICKFYLIFTELYSHIILNSLNLILLLLIPPIGEPE